MSRSSSTYYTSLEYAIVIVLLSLVTYASSKSLSQLSNDNMNQIHSLQKRNAWWTKKSVDMKRNYQTLDSDKTLASVWDRVGNQPLFKVAQSASQPENNSRLQLAIGCYTSLCIPDFVICVKDSTTQTEIDSCRLYHGSCAQDCFENTSYHESI